MNRFKLVRCWHFAGCLALSCCASGFAETKSYPALKTAIVDSTIVTKLQREAANALSGGLTDVSKRHIRNYYVQCVIHAMTTKEAMSDAERFPSYRDTLSRAFQRARDAQTRSYLVNLFNLYLSQIVATEDLKPTPFSPAARYNAMLAIGQLDDRRDLKKSGSKILYPIPNAKARLFMINYIKANKQPDVVTVAALIGLKRHLSVLIADADQRKLHRSHLTEIAKLLKTIAVDKAPNGLSEDGHMWVRMLAIESLGLMRSGSFAPLMATITGDESERLPLRCAAADALGKLNYKKVNGLDVKKLVSDLEGLAHLVCTSEIARISQKMKSGSTFQKEGFDRGGLLETQRPEDKENLIDPLVQEMRRQLLSQLKCIRRIGDTGAAKTIPDADDKALLDKFLAKIERLWNVLKDDAKTMALEELVRRIESLAKPLEPTKKEIVAGR